MAVSFIGDLLRARKRTMVRIHQTLLSLWICLQIILRFVVKTVTPKFGEYAFVFETKSWENSQSESENALVNTDPDVPAVEVCPESCSLADNALQFHLKGFYFVCVERVF